MCPDTDELGLFLQPKIAGESARDKRTEAPDTY